MKIYTEKPKTRRARKVWEYFQFRNPAQKITKLWFNPNCWQRPSAIGNMWGWWVVEYDGWKISYEIPDAI